MSLTSYRAAPPRVTSMFKAAAKQPGAPFVFRFAERNGGGLLHPAPTSAEPAIRHASCGLDQRSNKNAASEIGSKAAFSTLRMGSCFTPPAKPGDDLLFHCLSNSTIGAVRFHGRVRDGIGWVTDAMVTKLW